MQLSVLVVALLVSLAIHMHDRGEVLSQASGMQAAQRIADIVKLLEPLAPPSAAASSRSSARRRSRSASISATRMRRPWIPKAAREAALFGAMLRRFLGDARPPAVAVKETRA